MPHLITTHARCKCCTTYETVPWPCALRVTESSIIMLKSWRDRLDNCAPWPPHWEWPHNQFCSPRRFLFHLSPFFSGASPESGQRPVGHEFKTGSRNRRAGRSVWWEKMARATTDERLDGGKTRSYANWLAVSNMIPGLRWLDDELGSWIGWSCIRAWVRPDPNRTRQKIVN
jgi:hypothetical protein